MKVYCVVEGGGNRRWRFFPVQDSELRSMTLPPLAVPMAAFGGFCLAQNDGHLWTSGIAMIFGALVLALLPWRVARSLLREATRTMPAKEEPDGR